MLDKEFLDAQEELGIEEFDKHYRSIFGKPVLDFVRTIVINLPEPCGANCPYCIDERLKGNSIDSVTFVNICEKMLRTFPNVTNVTITGGSIAPKLFSKLYDKIYRILDNAKITWNTNGVNIQDDYYRRPFEHINLHRASIYDGINCQKLQTCGDVMSLKNAKFKLDNLCIRTVVNEDFDLDEFASVGHPLFLNRLLPPTPKSDKMFEDVLDRIDFKSKSKNPRIDIRRHNVYLDGKYNNIPVRVGFGDTQYEHIPGRYPHWLNVCIIHRSGIVSGTWYEDDKVIYKPGG